MSDPRITPDPMLCTLRLQAAVKESLTDILRRPDGPRDRQLLFGDHVTVLHRVDDWAYIQSEKDRYCGYVRREALGPPVSATHRVSVRASHIYPRAHIKVHEQHSLSFASKVCVTDIGETFFTTTRGFIPTAHLKLIDSFEKDPAAVAALFLGTPYLWGGNSSWGIDCSGLVQAALLACGIPCPGDSDMQASLGQPASIPYQRNDLLFWKGHVALVTDPDTLIHANAHAMAVTYEPIADAIARIEAAGDGPLTAHRRVISLFGWINSLPET